MGQQFRIQRKIATLPVVAGQAATYDLPRGYDFETIYMRITGTVQVTTGATSVRAEAPAQAISRVELIADGRNTLFSAPFWYTCLARYDRDQTQNGARYTTPPSAATAATYTVEAGGTVDFLTPDGERPKDSNFRTNGLQLWQIRLTFGQAIDMFVPGAGVANFTGTLNVEIYTSEMVELADPVSGAMTTPNSLVKVSFQEIAVPTSNVNQEVRLPAGNLIKSVVLRLEGGTTAGEPGTASLNNLQAFSGVDIRLNLSGAALRMKNNNDFGYVIPGYYIADFTRSGALTARLTELWDVTKQAEPKISMDVVGGASVKAQVVVREYLGLAS